MFITTLTEPGDTKNPRAQRPGRRAEVCAEPAVSAAGRADGHCDPRVQREPVSPQHLVGERVQAIGAHRLPGVSNSVKPAEGKSKQKPFSGRQLPFFLPSGGPRSGEQQRASERVPSARGQSRRALRAGKRGLLPQPCCQQPLAAAHGTARGRGSGSGHAPLRVGLVLPITRVANHSALPNDGIRPRYAHAFEHQPAKSKSVK